LDERWINPTKKDSFQKGWDMALENQCQTDLGMTKKELEAEIGSLFFELEFAKQDLELERTKLKILERAAEAALNSYNTQRKKISVDGTSTLMYNKLKQGLEASAELSRDHE